MKYKVCPDCGASLDFNEICDCKKENGLPHANENSPNPINSEALSPSLIISQEKSKVKANPLRELRISKNIPAKEIIDVVKSVYPKYDKTLQSKCERSEEYGVELKHDAFDKLLAEYSPDELEKEKKRRRGGHRLTCKITCRLEDDVYAALIKNINNDGFTQMQAWLTYMVINYLKEKELSNG